MVLTGRYWRQLKQRVMTVKSGCKYYAFLANSVTINGTDGKRFLN
jgi:hypothetical protein